MEKTLQKIQEANPRLSSSSVKAYGSSLRQVQKAVGVVDLTVAIFKNPQDVFDSLEKSKPSNNTYKNKLAAIIAFLKAHGAPADMMVPYNDKIKSLKASIDNFNGEMKMSAKDDKNWIGYEELQRVAAEAVKKLPKTISSIDELMAWQKAVVLSFHSLYPLRNELADAKLFLVPKRESIDSYTVSKLTESSNDNYIVLNPSAKWGYVILKKYKTHKTYGDMTFALDAKLLPLFYKYAKLLTAYKKQMDITHDWLLMNRNYEKLSRNDFTRFVNDIFKDTHKSIGTTMIRKIVASHFYEGKGQQLKDLAHIMGHSTDTALEYYVKKDND
jgi:hypothetical protein